MDDDAMLISARDRGGRNLPELMAIDPYVPAQGVVVRGKIVVSPPCRTALRRMPLINSHAGGVRTGTSGKPLATPVSARRADPSLP